MPKMADFLAKSEVWKIAKGATHRMPLIALQALLDAAGGREGTQEGSEGDSGTGEAAGVGGGVVGAPPNPRWKCMERAEKAKIE